MPDLKDKHIVFVHPSNITLDARLLKATAIFLEDGALVTIYANDRNADLGPLDKRITLKTIPALLYIPTDEPNLNWKGKARQWLRNRFIDVPNPFRGIRAKRTVNRIRQEDPDLIYCINWSTADIGLRLAREGFRVLYETYEYSPSVLLHPGLVLPTRFRRQRIRAERHLMQRACTTIVASDGYQHLYQKDLPGLSPVTIYNVPPQDPLPPTPVHKPLRFYFQSIIRPQYGLENLVEALASIPEQNFTLDIQGFSLDDAFCQNLQEQIDQAHLDQKIQLLPPCQLDEVVSVANDYDVGVFTLPIGDGDYQHLNNIYTQPNKLFTYAAAGLGLVFSDYFIALHQILEDSPAIVWVDEKDAQQIALKLTELIERPQIVQDMKQASFKWVQNYTFHAEQEKLRETYREACARP